VKRRNGSGDELVEMAAHACLVAKDAATNLQELLGGSSRLATLALQQCERELDELERTVPGSSFEHLVTTQLVEDMARLGCRLIETAGALSKAVEADSMEKPPG